MGRSIGRRGRHYADRLERWIGSLYQPGGLVFATESGTLINPSNLRNRSFRPLLRRAGLPDICFHDLRHTCATLLLLQGTHPKLVQELLGHATIAMSLDTYSHFPYPRELSATRIFSSMSSIRCSASPLSVKP